MPVQPTDKNIRARTITGLRTLADFLEANPEIPVSDGGGEYTFISHRVDDAAERAEIDTIATALGEAAGKTSAGEYSVTKTFGAITYRASHIPARNQAVYRAFADLSYTIKQIIDVSRCPPTHRCPHRLSRRSGPTSAATAAAPA